MMLLCACMLKYAVCNMGVCLSVFGIFFSIETTATNFISIYTMPKFDRRSFPHNFEQYRFVEFQSTIFTT